ncbi:hypothetical protein D3C78_790060 [compost metagenome]
MLAVIRSFRCCTGWGEIGLRARFICIDVQCFVVVQGRPGATGRAFHASRGGLPSSSFVRHASLRVNRVCALIECFG